MSDVYDEILNSSNIQTILEYYGLKVIKNKCNCPFHNDSHPSMSIHPNKGIAKCFSCGAGGNAISFIQKYESEVNHNPISFREAMQKAIEIQRLNIVIPNTNNVILTEEQKRFQRLSNILRDAITISENNLKINNVDCKNAFSYLKSRNLSTNIINDFHIGFDVSTNNLMNILLSKYSLDDLKEIGIIKEYNNDYINVFSNRIMIPIFDATGNPVGFGARTIKDNVKPKYLNTRETKLFNKSNLLFNYHKAKSYARNDEVIIVEGYMDVISAKAMKMDNVVGSMGTALTKEHIELIKKLNCEVTLCLDNDQAGKDAMARIIPELLKVKLKVNVLDISKLGNYKDFGDLQMANMTRENIYKTKISAFTFLLQYKYIQNNELNVENIHNIYNKMWKDGLIKDTKDILNFKEYMINNTNYSSDEIDNIINPTKIQKGNENDRIDRYKDVFFYHYILGLIKNYATKNQDQILLKYIELGKLSIDVMKESLNNENYLKDNELTINIGSYIKDFIFKTKDYINFKNDKVFILESLLNNAKSFDSKGNIINVTLTMEQKELVIKQYSESFDNQVRNYIENNPDEFEEIFISNSNEQFKKLFPKTYKDAFKEQSISRYVNDGAMEAIRYGLAYTDDMKSVMTRQYVNNNKYKTLLVFNNNKNILGLNAENIKGVSKEDIKEIEPIKQEEKIEKTENKGKNPMSIFIKLSGKEKETYKGIYLPINQEKQVYIPKQLYRKNEDKIQLLSNQSNNANMSEYEVNSNEHTKKFSNRLTLDEFYKKYFKLYEIQMEKEVMT